MAEAIDLKNTNGALVGDVLPDGPAAKAGLRGGDVIYKAGNRLVPDADALMNQIAETRPGTTLPLTLAREGKSQIVKVQIAEKKEEPARASRSPGGGTAGEVAGLGLEVSPLTPESRERFGIPEEVSQGLVVGQVARGGKAAGAGLEPGDVLLDANKTPLGSEEDLRAVAKKAADGAKILLLVSRRGTTFFSMMSTGEAS